MTNTEKYYLPSEKPLTPTTPPEPQIHITSYNLNKHTLKLHIPNETYNTKNTQATPHQKTSQLITQITQIITPYIQNHTITPPNTTPIITAINYNKNKTNNHYTANIQYTLTKKT